MSLISSHKYRHLQLLHEPFQRATTHRVYTQARKAAEGYLQQTDYIPCSAFRMLQSSASSLITLMVVSYAAPSTTGIVLSSLDDLLTKKSCVPVYTNWRDWERNAVERVTQSYQLQLLSLSLKTH